MNFTGTQTTIKRNFYPQNNNLTASFDFAVDNPTGIYQFGFSGTSGNLLMTLQSGKMLDFSGRYISSYQTNAIYSLNLQSASGNYNIWLNNRPLVSALPISQTGGYYDYFMVSRPTTNDNIEFDLVLEGDNQPIVNITNQGFLLTTGQTGVTGYVTNNGQYYINVFESVAQNLQGLSFSNLTGIITGGGVKTFIYNGSFAAFTFNQPILTTFRTNYNNDIEDSFFIIDLTTGDRSVFIQPTTFSFNSNNQIIRTIGYNNYSGGVLSNFPAHLNFTLRYISGAGTYTIDNFASSVFYYTTGYGNIIKSGLLTGNFYSNTGNQYISGLYIISGTQFQWATGSFSKLFSGTSTGSGTGLGYTGLAISDFTGIINVTILNGSGTYLFNNQITGLPVAGTTTSFFYPNYNNATGYIDISPLLPGDTIYIGSSGAPIVNGFQYHNITGLSGYLNSNSNIHKTSVASGTNTTLYLNATISGSLGNNIFITPNDCNIGQLIQYSPYFTSGINIGSTGVGIVALGIFTGQISTTIIGTGNYSAIMSGISNGIFTYTKTFTGQWDVLTGIPNQNLISLKTNPNFNSTVISGSGLFPANSYFTIQVNHSYNPYGTDAALLIISGDYVVDPQIVILEN